MHSSVQRRVCMGVRGCACLFSCPSSSRAAKVSTNRNSLSTSLQPPVINKEPTDRAALTPQTTTRQQPQLSSGASTSLTGDKTSPLTTGISPPVTTTRLSPDVSTAEKHRLSLERELARVREMNRAFEQQMTGTLSPPKSPPRAPVTPTKETPFKVSTAAVGAQI